MTPTDSKRVSLWPWIYTIAFVYFALHRYGLPKAISGHQNYFLWGPRHYTGEIIILLGETETEAREHFESVTG